jgi:hypothetical protein
MQQDYKYGFERAFEVTQIIVADQIIINSETAWRALILALERTASRCRG